MTLAFVVGIVGYLVGMLHGKRLSAPRERTGAFLPDRSDLRPEVNVALATVLMQRRARRVAREQIIVNTQYNAHPPVS